MYNADQKSRRTKMNGAAVLLLIVMAVTLPVLLPATRAGAAIDIDFSASPTAHNRLLIDNYYKTTNQTPPPDLAMGLVDLNEDGIYELILRSDCSTPSRGKCFYRIMAERHDTLIELGEFEAFDIKLGNAYADGVRNIIAYTDETNDFNRAVYIWEPGAARYMMEKK